MNYQEEYYKIINDLKYKLSKLYLHKNMREKFNNKMAEIELMITDNSNDFTYYEAFLKAVSLDTMLNAYIKKYPEIILPPCENESYLQNQVTKKSNEIKKYQTKLQKLKTRVITCALTGSLILTAGAYTIVSNNEKTNEKLYLTHEITYYDNTNNTRYHSSYEEALKNQKEVTIKMLMPWVMGEKEATREVRTYRINNVTYNEIVTLKNYEKVIDNLTYESKVETMSIENLTGLFHYQEPIYEVTEISQDEGNYIQKKSFLDKETVIALFAELLIYLLVLGINDGPLFESILTGLNDIKATEKVIASKKGTLKLLKKQMTF